MSEVTLTKGEFQQRTRDRIDRVTEVYMERWRVWDEERQAGIAQSETGVEAFARLVLDYLRSVVDVVYDD